MFILKRITDLLNRRKQTQEEIKDSGFIPVKDEKGNVTGVMDSTMAAYLESKAPDPSQQTLDDMLADVTRVKIFDSGMIGDKIIKKDKILEISDGQIIKLLRNCLEIVEDPESYSHCMCHGDLSMEFYNHQKRLAVIGFHHGISIRWNMWKHDALLKNSLCYLTLLAEQGIHAPLNKFQADRRRKAEAKEAWNRWVQASPDCFKKISPETWHNIVKENNLQPITDILASHYSDSNERILNIFRWFGSGKGPWTGYPSYEEFAEAILLTYPKNDLFVAVASRKLTENELEGAARLFSGILFQDYSKKPTIQRDSIWFSGMALFIPERNNEPAHIPDALKQILLNHTLKFSDEDKIDRAKKAFG